MARLAHRDDGGRKSLSHVGVNDLFRIVKYDNLRAAVSATASQLTNAVEIKAIMSLPVDSRRSPSTGRAPDHLRYEAVGQHDKNLAQGTGGYCAALAACQE